MYLKGANISGYYFYIALSGGQCLVGVNFSDQLLLVFLCQSVISDFRNAAVLPLPMLGVPMPSFLNLHF